MVIGVAGDCGGVALRNSQGCARVLGAHRTVRTRGNTGVGLEDLNKTGLGGVLSIPLDGGVESVHVFDVPVRATIGGE